MRNVKRVSLVWLEEKERFFLFVRLAASRVCVCVCGWINVAEGGCQFVCSLVSSCWLAEPHKNARRFSHVSHRCILVVDNICMRTNTISYDILKKLLRIWIERRYDIILFYPY